jgi:hypothetical protein
LLYNRIRVQTALTEENAQIVSIVHSAPRLVLHVVYNFQPRNGVTTLTQYMSVTGYPWLLGWVIRQATNVQQQTLANLKSRLEAASTPDNGA